MSYTCALLGVHPTVFEDIRSRMAAAGYRAREDEKLDMHGIALIPDTMIPESTRSEQLCLALQEADAALDFAVAAARERHPDGYRATAVHAGKAITEAALRTWGTSEPPSDDDAMVMVPRSQLTAIAGELASLGASPESINRIRKYTQR